MRLYRIRRSTGIYIIYIATAVVLALGAGGAVYCLKTNPAHSAPGAVSGGGSATPKKDQGQAGSPGAGSAEVAYRPVSYEELPSALRAVVDEQRKNPTVLVVKGSGESQYVLIALGERPTAGYQVAVDAVRETSGRVQVEYREVAPAKGAMVAQVLTYPWIAIRVDSARPIDVIPSERIPLEPADKASEGRSFLGLGRAMVDATAGRAEATAHRDR